MIEHWPLAGLRVRFEDVELRLPDSEELASLAELAARGVHEPGARPFLIPWTDRPPAERARYQIQGHWRRLGNWEPDDWSLEFAVFHRGVPVGCQEVFAADFAALREATTSSWLGLEYHGQGIGTKMRRAVLHLIFAGLDGAYALTNAFQDNYPSRGVSRKFGYRPDGITRDVLHGEVVITQRMRLSRADWEAAGNSEVTVTGLEPCRELFGLT